MKLAALTIHARYRRGTALATGMALLATASTLLVDAAPAQADAVNIECAGTQTFTYTPGLTPVPQTVTFGGGAMFGCGSPTHPAITSGSYETVGQATLTCSLASLDGTSGESVYHWNTNVTSTVSWTTTVAVRPLGVAVLVFTGIVTAGEFLGANLAGNLTLSPTGGALDCFDTNGVTEASGPISFTLNKLN